MPKDKQGERQVVSGELLHLTALTAKELRAVTSVTLAYYDQDANSFWQGTRDHDVSQNVEALLRHLRGEKPYTILDFGCGPGRDLVRLRKLGHEAVGLDGAEQFVQMARDHSGCEILHQDFLDLDFSSNRFDGVFANASLFHVPGATASTGGAFELPQDEWGALQFESTWAQLGGVVRRSVLLLFGTCRMATVYGRGRLH